MTDIATPAGPARLRPETDDDAEFRFRLFCLSREPGLAALAATSGFEPLLRLQFTAQSRSYAADCPLAQRLIVETAAADETFQTVGRVVVDSSAEGVRLIDIALLPEWRNRGLGAALTRHFQQEAKRLGAPMRLSVAHGNPAAARLYRRLGFVAEAQDKVQDEVYARMVWRPDGAFRRT